MAHPRNSSAATGGMRVGSRATDLRPSAVPAEPLPVEVQAVLRAIAADLRRAVRLATEPAEVAHLLVRTAARLDGVAAMPAPQTEA